MMPDACPICGAGAIGAGKGAGRYAITCSDADCQTQGPMQNGLDAAIAAWNRRAENPEADPMTTEQRGTRSPHDVIEDACASWVRPDRIAETALSALTAAGYAVEQGWQPIETAPRDGTRFIAWFPPCPQLPAGGWHECQWHNGAWHHPFFVEPTHWRPVEPLPAPPAGEGR